MPVVPPPFQEGREGHPLFLMSNDGEPYDDLCRTPFPPLGRRAIMTQGL